MPAHRKTAAQKVRGRTICVPDEIWKPLQRAARENNLGVSEIIRHAVIRWMDDLAEKEPHKEHVE